jgi:hypothetical protein
MSTPNFHKVHARNYYVVNDETTYYDEEQGKDVPYRKESEDYDLDIEDACEYGKECGFTTLNTRDRSNYTRSMGSTAIMAKSDWYSFGKKSAGIAFNNFEFSQEIYVQNGYYFGMNYDWDININDNFGGNFRLSEYDDVDSMVDDIMDAWQEEASDEWNAGMTKIQSKNLKRWLLKMIDKFSDEADDMCRDICEDVYVCGGIFSNGEAIYYRADSLKGKACNVEAA